MDDSGSDERTRFQSAEGEKDFGCAAAAAKVWVLTGGRGGDNNQMVALAEAISLPYELKRLRFNQLRRFKFMRGPRLLYVTRQTRDVLKPPWPALVIGLGYDSMPVARYIKRRSGGKTRLVQLGNPRTTIDDIDLLITTPQYPRKPAPNVLSLPFPIGNPARGVVPTGEEEAWLKRFPRPRRLIAVGGSTRQWQIDNCELDRAMRYLQRLSSKKGGSVIAATSRRTTPATQRTLEARLTGDNEAVVENFPSFGFLLASCDEFYVTSDSVSMLAEAIFTGKPVGMIPIKHSARGKIGHALRRLGLKLRPNTDMSNFWDYLTANKLAGTVEWPVASKVSDTIDVAADAVHKLLQAGRKR